jgi:hypothetical protein
MTDIFFEGYISIDRPLKHWQMFYLRNFYEMRHVKRDLSKFSSENWILKLLNLMVGIEGEYFIPCQKPTINCNIKHFQNFKPYFQKIIVTLFCIHRFHYQQLDKNVFILIANHLIKASLLFHTNDHINTDIMVSYAAFYNCLMFKSLPPEIDQTVPEIIDYNRPPVTQPGVSCHWDIIFDGTKIIHNSIIRLEPFYNYVGWLDYLIKNFLKPWGYTLNGSVKYTGLHPDNHGCIKVINNIVDEVDG